MNELLFNGYECLTVVLPIFITFVILSAIYKNKNIPPTKGRFLMLSIFAIYIFAVFYVTNVGTIFDLQRYGIQLTDDQINLLPFSREINTVDYFLNFLLFVPFGFLLPFIWPVTDRFKYTVFSGLSFSLLVEISQLFNVRHTDIDDLLLNTLGTLIGYLLFRMVTRLTNRTALPVNYFRYESAIYILAIFFGHFVLFNGFGFAKILYGF